MIALFGIALASAFFTYYFAASHAWTLRFDSVGGKFTARPGFWFELSRALLYTSLFVTVTFWSFPEEYSELILNIRTSTAWARFNQLIILFFVLIMNAHIINHHIFDKGYNGIQREIEAYCQNQGTKQRPTECDEGIEKLMEGTRNTYIVFLPYSISLFGVIAPIVGGIMFYRAGKDAYRALSSPFSVFELENSWDEVATKGFFTYRNRLLDTLTRYMRFFIVATLVYAFERMAGVMFNTDEAHSQILLFWWVIFLCPVLLVATFLAYCDSYYQVKFKAPSREQQKLFRDEYSLKTFAEELISENPLAMITIVVNGLTLASGTFFDTIKTAIGGMR